MEGVEEVGLRALLQRQWAEARLDGCTSSQVLGYRQIKFGSSLSLPSILPSILPYRPKLPYNRTTISTALTVEKAKKKKNSS